MGTATYNGFKDKQRGLAGIWQEQQYAAGTIARPTECCACGQTEGVLIHHCEDYSEPFTFEKTCKYSLCYRCHMAVHCRFHLPDLWRRYREMIHAGCRYPATTGGGFGFGGKAEHYGTPPTYRPLDEIEAYTKQPDAVLGPHWAKAPNGSQAAKGKR